MKSWFTRHMQTLVGSLGRLLQQRVQTAMTVLVIGIALALPACLQVLVINARLASGDWNKAMDLSVYLKPNTPLPQAEQLATHVRQRPDVAAVQLIKADDALAEFRAHSGFSEALNALTSNPLPHALIVRPAAGSTANQQIDSLARDLKQYPEIDIVQLDTAWVARFNAMLDTARRVFLLTALLLSTGVAIIVGNTIRADIQSRRAEIEITKLVGGSDAFVRRPFLYTGAWYGLGGGLFACSLIFVVVAVLAGPIRRLAALYGAHFELSGLGWSNNLWLLLAGMILGWFGSLLAASWHLRAIEPV